MSDPAKLPKKRPAEVATVGAGAVAATIAAITGIDTTAAAILVGAFGVVPTVVTWMVDTVRRGTQTASLVRLTPRVANAAEDILAAAEATRGWKAKAEALDQVATAVGKWSQLLAVQPTGEDAEPAEK